MSWSASPSAGGCDFPHDPGHRHGDERIFWAPRHRPHAIRLKPALPFETAEPITVRLAALDGLELRQAHDGWHGIWTADGIAHQLWLPDADPEETASLAVCLPLDQFVELRLHAVRRFWRCVRDRAPGPPFGVLPAQLRQWHILSLRALDARLRDESYRSVAEVLLGFRGTKEDFEIDPRKNRARRLVQHGLAMMRGGYLRLLHYPIRSQDR